MPRIRKQSQSLKETAIKIWKVALYIRLSKEDGHDVSYSVENQKQRLLQYLELSEEEMDLVDIYIDDGYTGTDSNRAGFQRLLADIRAKKVNCVIVKDPSRLSRNYIEAGHYMEHLFVTLDVRFISLELPALDSYKFPEQMNSIAVPIQNVVNDDFCRQTSIKIRGVLDSKRKRGEFIGAFAPYGYLKDSDDRHHLIVNPEPAPVVKNIFQWYLEGMGKNGISKKLIALGIPSPTEYKKQLGMNYHNPHAKDSTVYWSTRTIDQILKNPTYLGHMVQGRHKVRSYKIHTIVALPEEEWFWVENTHEAIIDEEAFNSVQDLLKRDMRVSPKQKNVYLFSGFLRCADCKGGMTRRSSNGYTYYCCRTYVYRSKELCASSHIIKDDLLTEAVLKAVQTQIDLIANMADLIEEINAAPARVDQTIRIDKLLKAKEQELQKITGITDNLYLDWKSGDITRTEYHRMKGEFEAQTEQLREVIENLKNERKSYEKEITSDDPYLLAFLKYKNIQKLERSILVELVDTIYIHADKGIDVVFKFQDQYQRLMDYIESNLAAQNQAQIKAVI